MMKKLMLMFAFFCGFASSKAYPKDNFTGFYLGGHTGYGSTTGKLTSQKTHGAGHIHFGTARPVNGSGSVGSHSHHIGIVGGYGFVFLNVYLGAELGYTQTNERIKSTFGNDPVVGKRELILKRNGYFSLAPRMGFLLNDESMFYIRLGINQGKWSFTDNLTGNFNSRVPANKSSNKLTFAPGLGLESAFQGMLVRFEYSFEYGKSIKAVANTADAHFRRSYSNISKIRTQSAKIGLAYKF